MRAAELFGRRVRLLAVYEDKVKVQQTPLFFAAIRIDGKAKRILITYLDRRWAPFGRETFNEDIKGHLGFEAYQPRLFQASGIIDIFVALHIRP